MSNVRDFGARGDGRSDDSDAIEHAIADGDGVVHFSRGDYRITRTIVVNLAKGLKTPGGAADPARVWMTRQGIDGSGGTARILMDGPGPAFLVTGSHGGNADPRNVSPSVWHSQRMPTIRDIEIAGLHAEADGIRLEGVMEPLLSGVLLRSVRHAIHVTGRARNLLVSHCHIYRNTGIGIFLDRVNLHQAVIASSHISYCRLGGIRIEGGEIRNLQITGNDIEYNTNASIGVERGDDPSAEIWIDARDGSIREGTIASNTIQATATPGGANIRFVGTGADHGRKVGMWTIVGNLIGSQTTNIHLTSGLGFAISGNYLYSGHERTMLLEDCRAITIGDNCVGHNADYGDLELSTGIRLADCRDCTISGLLIQDARAGTNTVQGSKPSTKQALVELVRCRRITMTGCQLLEGTPIGLLVEDSHDVLVSGCTILDTRAPALMERSIVWRTTPGQSAPTGCGVHACRLADLGLPDAIARSANVLGPAALD
ncbi:MAG: right-handed parallel beta-helix repeat-containing protein [Planctomycetaceae bacterium]